MGRYVAVSHILPHLDPEVFEDPAAFEPARFVARRYDEFQLTTFSHGRHKCPGERLAVMLIRGAVAAALRQFDVAAPAPIPPLSFERATLAQRRGVAAAVFRPVGV